MAYVSVGGSKVSSCAAIDNCSTFEQQSSDSQSYATTATCFPTIPTVFAKER